jgi:hypothetical protein
MSTTAISAPQDYPALIAAARIAAIRALTDILATSDDPTERRHAATAILRAPEPEAPAPPATRPAIQPASPRPGTFHPDDVLPGSNTTIREVLLRAQQVLQQNQRPPQPQQPAPGAPHQNTPLCPPNSAPAARLATSAGQAPSPSTS